MSWQMCPHHHPTTIFCSISSFCIFFFDKYYLKMFLKIASSIKKMDQWQVARSCHMTAFLLPTFSTWKVTKIYKNAEQTSSLCSRSPREGCWGAGPIMFPQFKKNQNCLSMALLTKGPERALDRKSTDESLILLFIQLE